jgi:hypothetical protein
MLHSRRRRDIVRQRYLRLQRAGVLKKPAPATREYPWTRPHPPSCAWQQGPCYTVPRHYLVFQGAPPKNRKELVNCHYRFQKKEVLIPYVSSAHKPPPYHHRTSSSCEPTSHAFVLPQSGPIAI